MAYFKTIEISAYLAANIFNDGFFPILKVMTIIGIEIDEQNTVFPNARDEKRLERSERRSLQAIKEARTQRRMERVL